MAHLPEKLLLLGSHQRRKHVHEVTVEVDNDLYWLEIDDGYHLGSPCEDPQFVIKVAASAQLMPYYKRVKEDDILYVVYKFKEAESMYDIHRLIHRYVPDCGLPLEKIECLKSSM